MSARIPWTERNSISVFSAALFPEMIELVRGTPARLDNRIASLPNEILTRISELIAVFGSRLAPGD